MISELSRQALAEKKGEITKAINKLLQEGKTIPQQILKELKEIKQEIASQIAFSRLRRAHSRISCMSMPQAVRISDQ